MTNLGSALAMYDSASSYMEARYAEELEWQRNSHFQGFSETDFLREFAWVVLCSGFRERTVRSVFDYISLCFCDWESAAAISCAGNVCTRSAAVQFRNIRKLNAILSVADKLAHEGFANFKRNVIAAPAETLCELPFIGPVTVWHLLKNLGLDVSKPDRHLVRASKEFGFESSEELCDQISAEKGEPAKVVDLVIWRYLADHPSALTSRRFIIEE